MKLKSLIKGDVLSIMASQLKRQKSHKLKNFELSDKIESQIKIYIHGIIETKNKWGLLSRIVSTFHKRNHKMNLKVETVSR